MTGNNGNRARVLKRWGLRGVGREKRAEREPFNGTPQFTFDQIYISPFTHKRVLNEAGRKVYVPLERNMKPTGFDVMDAYLRSFLAGMEDVGDFCRRYNARTSDLDGVIFMLTGMSNKQLRARWVVRCADELLRFTDMEVAEVARRSGAGSRTNLYFIYERDLNTSPTQRRWALRKNGDLGLYKIEENKKGATP